PAASTLMSAELANPASKVVGGKAWSPVAVDAIVIVNVWDADNPPAPSSAVTVTLATPTAFCAGLNESVPLGLPAGCTENRRELSFTTRKMTTCASSLEFDGVAVLPIPEAHEWE